MDTEQIICQMQEMEKVHRLGDYARITSLLKGWEDVHVTVEQLQGTNITDTLYKILKSCPVTSVKIQVKLLLAKWKTLDCGLTDAVLDEWGIGGREHGGEEPEKAESTACRPDAGGSDRTPCVSQQRECHLVAEPCDSHPAAGGTTVRGSPVDAGRNVTVMSPELCKEGPSGAPVIAKGTPVVAMGIPTSQNGGTSPLRHKCSELLFRALSTGALDPAVSTAHCRELAHDIEEHVFSLHARKPLKYKSCVRSKISNLNNARSPHLRQGLLSGLLSPQTFAGMSATEMASEELRLLRAQYTKSGIGEHQLPRQVEGTPTTKVRCQRCQRFDCSVMQVSRGTLFLPAWVRSAEPEGDMVTFLTCNGCGEQWYHSGWNCL